MEAYNSKVVILVTFQTLTQATSLEDIYQTSRLPCFPGDTKDFAELHMQSYSPKRVNRLLCGKIMELFFRIDVTSAAFPLFFFTKLLKLCQIHENRLSENHEMPWKALEKLQSGP